MLILYKQTDPQHDSQKNNHHHWKYCHHHILHWYGYHHHKTTNTHHHCSFCTQHHRNRSCWQDCKWNVDLSHTSDMSIMSIMLSWVSEHSHNHTQLYMRQAHTNRLYTCNYLMDRMVWSLHHKLNIWNCWNIGDNGSWLMNIWNTDCFPESNQFHMMYKYSHWNMWHNMALEQNIWQLCCLMSKWRKCHWPHWCMKKQNHMSYNLTLKMNTVYTRQTRD